ncbi:hypothetical protein KM043_006637 [Ampulex compressa]|nr:hypothetical protein KM043_006637 [Ampulex compressa]
MEEPLLTMRGHLSPAFRLRLAVESLLPAGHAYRRRLEPPLPVCHRRTVRYTEECRDNRRLGGGANGEPEESSCRRESRGACCRNPSPRRRSPSFDRSSSFSSSRCPRGNQETSGKTCKPCCAPSTKFEPRKRDCCRCTPGYCMCQPMPRSCNCPPPVQVDARADRECSCDCPSSPECSCPPSERRFPRTTIACPNARACRPKPRLPPGPKCHCVRCQPCLPPPCDPCTSSDCRSTMPEAKSCMPDHDQRPVSADFSRQDSSCPRCCKVSWSGVEEDKWGCLQDEKSRRGSRGSSPVRKMAGSM